MIVLGIIALVLGFLLGIQILWLIGIILVVIGLVLLLAGYAGHSIGPRRHYWLCTTPRSSTACGCRSPRSRSRPG